MNTGPDSVDDWFDGVRERLWRDLVAGDAEAREDLSGQRIHSWRIDELISRGGFATVYRAHRDDDAFEQTVAFKVLRRGLDTEDVVARFRAERQILSSLAHPSIAQILDGGALPDGRPFLVLEFVRGQPITEYCDTHKIDIPGRIRLLIEALRALHHAHTHLVIHRDVKPSNILVSDEGHVALLDFGIAKLLDAEALPGGANMTRTGMALLTPGYASPEQQAGETITTATDIYQSGLLLYELLAGRRPFEAKPATRDAPVPPPSAALRGTARHKAVRGDLDAITRKATHLEPALRYASADEMVQDLQRYLEGRPVLAQPDTLSYRLRKLTSRRPWLMPLLAIVIVGVLAYLVTLTAYSTRLKHEQQLAATARQFMVDLFRSPDPYAPADPERGLNIRVVDALEIGKRRVRAELSDQPELRAALLASISDVYASLDQYREAIDLREEALALERMLYDVGSPRVLESLRALGGLYTMSGDMGRAEALLREQLELARASYPAGSPELALAQVAYGMHENNRGNLRRSRELLLAALEPLRARPAEHARTLVDVFIALEQQSAFVSDPLPFDPLREAEQIARDAFGGDSLQAALARVRLASTLTNRGDYEASEQNFLAAIPVLEAKLGKEHSSTIGALNNLGYLYHKREDLAGAERVHRELLARNLARHGAMHRLVADSYQNLGGALTYQGRYEESLPLHREAYNTFRVVLNEDNYVIAIPLLSIAFVELQRGDLPRAEAAAREAMERLASGNGGRYLDGAARCLLGVTLEQQGRAEEGAALVAAARELVGAARLPAPYPPACQPDVPPAD